MITSYLTYSDYVLDAKNHKPFKVYEILENTLLSYDDNGELLHLPKSDAWSIYLNERVLKSIGFEYDEDEKAWLCDFHFSGADFTVFLQKRKDDNLLYDCVISLEGDTKNLVDVPLCRFHELQGAMRVVGLGYCAELLGKSIKSEDIDKDIFRFKLYC
ncbi:MAG: hypothetical protein K6G73_12280 [Marinilabiliaceae bacterium]|nr:hypothetical protein [Marinilabiliaceae bacterium]